MPMDCFERTHPIRNTSWLVACLALGLFFSILLTGCASPQIFSTIKTQAVTLEAGELEDYGLAFITPSTATGHEQDKQALALMFANVFNDLRPDVRIVTLPETLGHINRKNLATDYKAMYTDYSDTGIFDREVLSKVYEATGAKYLAQLKLARFRQGSSGRWSLLGIRLVETKYANIRIFLQIWDSSKGSISWEGMQELNYSNDSFTDNTVNFKIVVEETARTLISGLP